MLEASAPPAIEVQGLTRSYGHQHALRGLNLTVPAGQFVTIFGPNGAGKTTLIRVLSSLVRPSAGTVRIFGEALDEAGGRARRRLGVISHQTLLYPNLTGRENLRFFGNLYGLPDLNARVEEVLAELELTARGDSLARTLSKGLAQRLAIARAIIHRPDVILLDEPYTGLDQRAAALLSQLLERLRDGQRTLLMTTHQMEQGLELSHRLCIQQAGRLIYDTPREGLTVEGFRQTYFAALEATGRKGAR